MKKAIAIAALAATICLLAGCDFLRTLAGRPTSRDIEAKRAQVELEAAAEARADSLAQARLQAESDSLAAEAALSGQGGVRTEKQQPAPQGSGKPKQLTPKQLQGVEKYDLVYRYYLMIGVFRSPDNATRQAERARSAGYPVTLIPMKNGMTAVGVCGADDVESIYASFQRLRAESFCPEDAWILNNE